MKYHAIFFTDMSAKIWHMKSMGAYNLASELREAGYNVLVVDYLSKWIQDIGEFKKLLNSILSDETLFVGYSSTFFSKDNKVKFNLSGFKDYYGGNSSHWTHSRSIMNVINSYIKKINPNIKIFYGGTSVNNSIEHNLSDCQVDYAVRGYSNGKIVEILNNLRDKKYIKYNLNACKNIKLIDDDPIAKTFNFAGTVMRYHESDIISSSEVLPLEISRGCLFKCKFCSHPLLGRKKNDPEYHKHQTVLTEELKYNYEKFGTTKYIIVDDTFNESTTKLQQVYDSIKESGINIEFYCYLRLDLIERYPEQIQLLKDMGLKSCFLGVETLNLKSAKSVGKSSDPEKVKSTLIKMREIWSSDVKIFAAFISGLPYENKETIDEWMTWVYDRKDLIDAYYLNTLNIDQIGNVFLSDIDKQPESFGYDYKSPTEWVNNVGLTYNEADAIANDWMEKSWKDGRLKVAGWEALGMQNMGYTFEQLDHYTLDTLPIDEFGIAYKNMFNKYKNSLFDYISRNQNHV
jgi:hypothetical protein